MEPLNLSPAAHTELVKLSMATRDNVVATMAAALIVASGRPHSVGEAMKVFTDFQNTLYPERGRGSYEAWQKAHDPNAVHM